jgi:hypothetical protein
MDVMSTALVVFAYKRPKHLETTLTALAASAGAQAYNLFVFCDGPRKSADMEAVARVRDIAKNAKGFRSVRVQASSVNLGLGRSVIEGVSAVLDQYDSVIVVEDDIEVATGFLPFMQSALNLYRDNQRVFSISGYVPPVQGGDRHGDAFFVPRICPWGWGTWRDRWRTVDWQCSEYWSFMADRQRRAEFTRCGKDMLDMIINQIEGEAESWAIRFDFGRYNYGDALTLYPTRSLTSNTGMDGSGEHREASTHYVSEVSDQLSFDLPVLVREAEDMTRAFSRFYPRRLRSRLAIWARRLHVHGPARKVFRLVFD